MEEKIYKIHQVISDLDEEMNWMRDNGDCPEMIISVEGHRRMIAGLDEFCDSVGFPCATFDDLTVKEKEEKELKEID